MLTHQQILHIRTFGYLTLGGLLSPDEATALRDEADSALTSAFGPPAAQATDDLGGISGEAMTIMLSPLPGGNSRRGSPAASCPGVPMAAHSTFALRQNAAEEVILAVRAGDPPGFRSARNDHCGLLGRPHPPLPVRLVSARPRGARAKTPRSQEGRRFRLRA